jgi:hypothetical protein
MGKSMACAAVNSMLARVVSKWVLFGMIRPARHGEQDLLGGPALMGRQDVPEREQAGHRVTERVERGRSGVSFVAPLDAGPLLGRHRARPRVGEQVDQHLLGPDFEQVVPGGRQRAVRSARVVRRIGSTE